MCKNYVLKTGVIRISEPSLALWRLQDFFFVFPNEQSSLALDASRYAICTLVMMGPTTAGEKHPGKLNWRQDGY